VQAVVGIAEGVAHLGQVAAVFQRDVNAGQRVVVGLEGAEVVARDAGDDPGVLAAGVACRAGGVGIGAEAQIGRGLPFAVQAELRGVDHAVFGARDHLGRQAVDGHAGDQMILDHDIGPAVLCMLDVVGLVVADGRCVEPRWPARRR
jgi:hypothetical protein